MDAEQILTCFEALNDYLEKRDVMGEVCLYGGAVMCLVYDARPSTKDVDAVFRPASIIREGARSIAEQFQLAPDWLNDGVKGFLVDHEKKVLKEYSNLVIWVAEGEYLLAMKALASRVDAMDKDDILTLVKILGITSPDEVFKILERYYPKNRIKPATQFFIEELFEK